MHITIVKGAASNGWVGYHALAVYNNGDVFEETKLSNDNGYSIYTDGEEKILIGYNGTETDLMLPSYSTKINQYAFSNCDGVTSVAIPDGVTSIGEHAFSFCSSLTSVVIPDSVTSIGYAAFYNCDSLTSITFEDTSTWYRTTSSLNWKNKTGGTSTDVTILSLNATYFESAYYNYYWYKL